MLTDIFSSFDDQNQIFPCVYLMMWIVSFLIIIMFNMNFWIFMYNWKVLVNFISEFMCSQITRTFGVFLNGFQIILVSLFSFLIFSNVSGLIPYVFSVTSHLLVSVTMAFPLWISIIISGVISSPKKVVGSLLPTGTPTMLSPFLVLIETVSILVRPLTLSVRLMANMSAGHVVLGLLGVYLSFASFQIGSYSVILSVIQVMYTIFEVAIGLVQAYIFCLLLTLYSDEHPHLDMTNL